MTDRRADAGAAAGRAPSGRLLSFDVLRIAAMGLVALQHLLSVADLHPTAVLGFTPANSG